MTGNEGHLLGLASGFFRKPDADRWREALAAGFTETELDFPWTLAPEPMAEDAKRNAAILREAGIHLSSAHLPFGHSWDVSALDPQRRETALGRLRGLLDWIGAEGIGMAVLHASFEPIPPQEREARLETAAQSIRELGGYARTRGATLAAENLPRTCLGNTGEEILRLTDNGRNAGVCFDVNHLTLESHAAFLDQTAPHLITTHLSDYDGLDEKHWLPGEGVLAWRELVSQFEAAGYRGRWLFELAEDETPALRRDFTPAELATRWRHLIG
jgi:sugar phosphate isomerase/epimerase